MRSFIRRKLAGLTGCTSGNATLIVALGMPMLIGGAGLGVDLAQWYMWKRELQFAVDQAAMAGAWARSDDATEATYVTRATQEFNANLAATEGNTTTPVVELANYAGGTGNSVAVHATVSHELPFSGLLTGNAPNIYAYAQAVFEEGNTFTSCLIAVDEDAEQTQSASRESMRDRLGQLVNRFVAFDPDRHRIIGRILPCRVIPVHAPAFIDGEHHQAAAVRDVRVGEGERAVRADLRAGLTRRRAFRHLVSEQLAARRRDPAARLRVRRRPPPRHHRDDRARPHGAQRHEQPPPRRRGRRRTRVQGEPAGQTLAAVQRRLGIDRGQPQMAFVIIAAVRAPDQMSTHVALVRERSRSREVPIDELLLQPVGHCLSPRNT